MSKGTNTRKHRIKACIADGLEIQHRFQAEPLLKKTGRGSYTREAVAEIAVAKKKMASSSFEIVE